MKKFLVLTCALLITLAACGGKDYQLSDKPVVTFKTNMGEFKIGFYKDAAPKSVEWFLKFCKEKKYVGIDIDLISLADYVIGVGYNAVFKAEVTDDLTSEIIPGKKELAKNEVFFRTDDERIGRTFYIYNRPNAIQEKDSPLVIFGKVIDGESFLDKVMEVRVDLYGTPTEKIEIIDVEVSE